MQIRRTQSGVLLLEALIGVLLFAIGILGIMALQAVAIRNTVDAKYRTEASYLANQIISRMWSDNQNLAGYVTAANAACPGTPTTEVAKWICAVHGRLPNASGANGPTITVNGTEVTVTVSWQKDASTPVHNVLVMTDIVD